MNKVKVWIWLPSSGAMMFWLDFDVGCYVFISFDFDEGHIPIWLLQFSYVNDSWVMHPNFVTFLLFLYIFWLNTFFQWCEYLHWYKKHLNCIMNWHFVDANLFADWNTFNLWSLAFEFLGYIVFSKNHHQVHITWIFETWDCWTKDVHAFVWRSLYGDVFHVIDPTSMMHKATFVVDLVWWRT